MPTQVVPRQPPQHDRTFAEPPARCRFREDWIRVVDANQDDATKRAGVTGEKEKRAVLHRVDSAAAGWGGPPAEPAAELCSCSSDVGFPRFPGLCWTDPPRG